MYLKLGDWVNNAANARTTKRKEDTLPKKRHKKCARWLEKETGTLVAEKDRLEGEGRILPICATS